MSGIPCSCATTQGSTPGSSRRIQPQRQDHFGALLLPGVRADGSNKFLVSYEAWRDNTATLNPGRLNAYIYHPEQRDIWGDHFFPTEIVLPFSSVPFNFGPEFISRPDVTPVLGRWYCYELMVMANTPGQRDGRIAFWLDGQLIADFPNLRLRDTTALKIDRFTLDLHVLNNNWRRHESGTTTWSRQHRTSGPWSRRHSRQLRRPACESLSNSCQRTESRQAIPFPGWESISQWARLASL